MTLVVLIDLEIGGTQIMFTGLSMTETIKKKMIIEIGPLVYELDRLL